MWQPIFNRSILILLLGTLATACSQNETANVAPTTPTPAVTATATTSPTPKPKATKSQPTTPTTPIPDTFQDATDMAVSATTISQSAVSREDWNLVASRWQEAIDLIKKVPTSSKNYKTAKTKLTEYENKLADAKRRGTPVVAAKPEETETNPQFFSIPIKGKYGGIPIVEIAFNGRTFDMLFDTGATNTLITLSAAESLDLKPVGSMIVTVADGSRVKVPIVEVTSVEIDGRIKKKLKVAVAPASMPIGLLGQDFFEGYDINIKTDAIEFTSRGG
ncbi:MAG TPA: aspartyl protease [Cyanobacteria bacterium UBA11149]|nr:aspartyl protease [Cyanobacteria bacterium UBA11366]HBK65720.1 aspartyl protease [Cyanobacteria bacterium UBA11166]HBR76235.1 aspartyl protease [Cyanobacteria bacterium UBA11159]HBS71294.1 aspartyl protease [Cyanobacteria bacterium UBA11153]HBW91977.1 aspartyl protease [Cyanobacteria bacterium UBA11149]HCA96950.1 aspartyl protease [Cyanobacteria bacterium UBA9226]